MTATDVSSSSPPLAPDNPWRAPGSEFHAPDDNRHEGWCSGDWTLGMVSDKLVIPDDLKPGKYVVSWRWDCEETAQVWQNCADVNILPRNPSD